MRKPDAGSRKFQGVWGVYFEESPLGRWWTDIDSM